jgi:luciferase family oxidoreductase group 1
VRDLVGFLHDSLPEDHPYRGVQAMPRVADDPGVPDVWLLGSSGQSAAYAAYFGLAFSFAHFINPYGSIGVLDEYREAFRPSSALRLRSLRLRSGRAEQALSAPRASLAVRVLCAATDEEAVRLSSSFALSRLRMERGERGLLPSVEEALAYPYSEAERARIAAIMAGVVIGGPERVRSKLEGMAAAHGVDEVVVVTICHDPAARRQSYELLAEVFGLGG